MVRKADGSLGCGGLGSGLAVESSAPADIRKEGSAFDLPIAVGILAATDQLNGAGGESSAAGLPRLGDFIVVGELGLEGDVRPIRVRGWPPPVQVVTAVSSCKPGLPHLETGGPMVTTTTPTTKLRTQPSC